MADYDRNEIAYCITVLFALGVTTEPETFRFSKLKTYLCSYCDFNNNHYFIDTFGHEI